MMLLMVSTALASLAIGVSIAYGLCSMLFNLFRIHSRAQKTALLGVEPHLTSYVADR